MPDIIRKDGSNYDYMLVSKIYKEYVKDTIIDTTRGQCENEAFNFGFYLEELGFKWKEDFIVNYGHFQIDNPIYLPLNLQDLKTEEYYDFLDLYEEEIDITDPIDLSISILEYVKDHKPSRISDFYLFNHAWVDFRGIIVDPTQSQFKQAVTSEITEDNYLYNEEGSYYE